MAPPSNLGKRVKGTQVFRPFIYGTTAKAFDPIKHPKPPNVPADHTHSWTVFVKGVDDVDVSYWLKSVHFKLHDSIANPLRRKEAEKGKPFEVHETGWGEFEIAIKLYYVAESGEKPQTLYHHLHLHPYGRTEAEKEAMQASGEVVAWTYEEQIFNEPYEAFYETLTSGALPLPAGAAGAGGSKSKTGKGGKGVGGKGAPSTPMSAGGGVRTEGGVLERSAMIPLTSRPGQPFSRDTEQLEVKRIRDATERALKLAQKYQHDLKVKEATLAKLRKENSAK